MFSDVSCVKASHTVILTPKTKQITGIGEHARALAEAAAIIDAAVSHAREAHSADPLDILREVSEAVGRLRRREAALFSFACYYT
jgi:hypothetical protein